MKNIYSAAQKQDRLLEERQGVKWRFCTLSNFAIKLSDFVVQGTQERVKSFQGKISFMPQYLHWRVNR